MSGFVQPENPSEAAKLKIVLKPLGVEVDCTVSERHSAEMVQITGIAMATLGLVLVLWVGTGTHYPVWVITTLALTLVGAVTTMCRRRWVGTGTHYPAWVITTLALALMGAATTMRRRRYLRRRRY